MKRQVDLDAITRLRRSVMWSVTITCLLPQCEGAILSMQEGELR
jgi:hypothetical protein